MQYKRPDIDELKSVFRDKMKTFSLANDLDEAVGCIREINQLRINFESMKNIAFINYSLDTGNEKFAEEQDYFDNNAPFFNDLVNEYYKALLTSKFRKELCLKFGGHLFAIAEMTMKSFTPEIVEDLQKENHLNSEYTKLKASAQIMFDGKERNLQELDPYMESTDREVRKRATDAYWNFFAENAVKFDKIFDELVSLRHDIAVKLGFKNFIDVGYARMKRFDYDQEMVGKFRENVKKYIVPLATKLRERQRKRIGVEKLMIEDINIQFKSGNAIPKGDPEWIMNKGKQMYNELSPSTAEFYDFMVENDLMDVYSRKGKADMGYCEFIAKYDSPYIFANMNGTEDDITVLTHEAGHAFQAYQSRNADLLEYYSPTSEACEIHSMSMEFLTYPWMYLFFKDDNEKFKFSHLTGAIFFLPYGVLVDEFQHWVYENPSASPDERKSKWRELEKIYLPHMDFGENEFLNKGGKWQKQSHIYEMPFYYIDYCLAQICAFQFWSKAIHSGNGKYNEYLGDYLRLCEAGGSQTFLELVKLAGLESPFEEEVVKRVVGEIEAYLDEIDDSNF